jgi:hypothetical protein
MPWSDVLLAKAFARLPRARQVAVLTTVTTWAQTASLNADGPAALAALAALQATPATPLVTIQTIRRVLASADPADRQRISAALQQSLRPTR